MNASPHTRCRLCRNLAHAPLLGSFDKLVAAENGLVDFGPINGDRLCALCALAHSEDATEGDTVTDEKRAAAHARKTAIWLELRAMFATQEARAEHEHEQRTQKNAREDELRRELEMLDHAIRAQHHNEHVDPLAGAENES